ncbi:hypothetical protein COJ90_21110 [Priestia megaterium]|uniref:AbrB/MazE/SpoVT family DNA-binding domain-containing protein n=1 Tax=Priestia megaterium TaxID=1404 RepID=UPI000BF8E275|nr:AbrB/MazE/SpoVT family DNA-binding domain-containing protein [Priestia megaterium]PFP09215.1 hypothetical protein COJ90_21110 [Priestia megaterium]
MFNPSEYNSLVSLGKVSLPKYMTNAISLNAGDYATFIVHEENIIIVKDNINVLKKDVLATGITQKLDKQNRITIPSEIRNNLNLQKGTVLEIRQIRGSLVLREHHEGAGDNADAVRYILRKIEAPSEEQYIYRKVKSEGRIHLTEQIINALGFKLDGFIQFFIRKNELVLKELEVSFTSPDDSTFTGETRKLDEKGNLVVAKKSRDLLGIDIGDTILIKREKNEVLLSKVKI